MWMKFGSCIYIWKVNLLKYELNHVDDLVHDCSSSSVLAISSVLAMELLESSQSHNMIT